MPDQWGRVGFNDFATVTSALNAVQGMGQRNISFKQNQDEYKKKLQDETDTASNFNALMSQGQGQTEAGGDAYSVPVDESAPMTAMALKGSPEAQSKSMAMVAGMKQAKKAIGDLESDENVRKLLDIFIGSGTFDIPENQKGKFKPSDVAIAQSLAAKTMRESLENKDAFLKQRSVSDMQQYADFVKDKKLISDALQTGDKESAAKMISGMSKKMSMPYKYEYDKDSDTFQEFYLHSGSGQYEPNGTSMKFSDVMGKINGMTPEEFSRSSYMFKQATLEWNEEARKPSGAKSGGGEGGKGQYMKKGQKEFYVFPQKPVNGTDSVHYIVMDQDNNETVFKSIQALQNAGFRYEDLKREKALGDIRLNEQQIKTSESAMNAHNRSNIAEGADAMGKQIKAYKDGISLSLSPFAKPGVNLFGGDGDGLSSGGENAMQAAMTFFEQNKDKAATLNETGKMKLEASRQAIQLWEQGRQFLSASYKLPEEQKVEPKPEQIGQAQPYTGDRPPVEGAQRRKGDGTWWVKQQDGKYVQVMGGQSDISPLATEKTQTEQDIDIDQESEAGRNESNIQNSPDDFKPIGQLAEGKQIGRTKYGYMIMDESGVIRQPDTDEMAQIRIMAGKGQLEETMPQYENKYPMDPTAMRGRGQIMTPNISGRK
ncbi:MAG TPA: hypothetical protein VGD14_09490 [bacterium]